ncbi:MAG: DUF1499 domain-containing protein [Cereibacter changlensis]
MKRMSYVLIALALLVLGFALYVRAAPSDAPDWHVDPQTVTAHSKLNSWLIAPGGDMEPVLFDLPPDQIAAKLEAVAAATPRTALLAGEGFHKTWVTRSALWGFPDYTSVWLAPTEAGGTSLSLYARSRFGKGDMGVNRQRVDAWLADLSR